MPRSRKREREYERAAHMRKCKPKKARKEPPTIITIDSSSDESSESDNESQCDWPGGIENHEFRQQMDAENVPLHSIMDTDDELELEEVNAGQYLQEVEAMLEKRAAELDNFRVEVLQMAEKVYGLTPYQQITRQPPSAKESKKSWKGAEKKLRTGVLTGSAPRTARRHAANARQKEEEDKKLRAG